MAFKIFDYVFLRGWESIKNDLRDYRESTKKQPPLKQLIDYGYVTCRLFGSMAGTVITGNLLMAAGSTKQTFFHPWGIIGIIAGSILFSAIFFIPGAIDLVKRQRG
jgi:hypothetical protein